ncbi:hypothetical protein L2E82_50317 [Cichorium intybus]|nr:hypothetical protein L2E82_50317 [Cichorium intybus]
MGNKSKQNQNSQRHVPDYERSKLLRVQENQERLRELGIKNIAKSLTSLVESQKKEEKKLKSVGTIERDVDFDSGSEEEYREVATIDVPQKRDQSKAGSKAHTMGDLILSKKGLKNRLFNQNREQNSPSSFTRRAKRKLFLVDSDGDMDDNERSEGTLFLPLSIGSSISRNLLKIRFFKQ